MTPLTRPAIRLWGCAILLLGLVSMNHLRADGEVRFDRLTVTEGLSQSSISGIAQCNDGYLWFGTQYGLDRFDGYSVRAFRHEPEDPTTLNDSFITDVQLANDGHLWVTTERGLNRFDTRTGHAERFAMPGLTEIVAEHPDGRLFLSADGRVRVWRPDTGQIHRIPFARELARSQLAERSGGLDHQGRYWVFNAVGLWRLDEVAERMELVLPLEQSPGFRMFNPMSITADGAIAVAADHAFLLIDPNSLEILEQLTLEDVGGVDDRFNAVMSTADGLVWLPTPTRLLRYRPEDRSLEVVFDGGRLDAAENERQRLTLHQHPNGDLWFASQYGLAHMDAETGEIRLLGHDPTNPFSMPQTIPRAPISLFIDRQGLVWVGTNLGGVGWHAPENARFRHIWDRTRPSSSAMPFAGQNVVRGIVETNMAGHTDLWLALDRAGIRRLRLASDGSFDWYRSYHAADSSPSGLPENRIWSLAADAERGLVWALGDRYLVAIDARSDQVVSRLSLRDALGVAGIGRSLLLARDGRTLWIGTTEGVWQFEIGDTPADLQRLGPQRLPELLVSDLLEAKTGDLLVAGVEGLGFIVPDEAGGDVFFSTAELHPTRSNHLHTIAPHHSQGWWIGGREIGLGHLRLSDLDDGAKIPEVEWFDQSSGLIDDTIYAIVPEPGGELWMSTNNGLMRWNPATGRARHFTPLDGVQALEFNRTVAHVSPRGEFYFGGINGVNRFRPDRFDSLQPPPRVLLQEVLVNGQTVDLAGADQPRLRLRHDENDLEIKFVGLQFSDPQRLRYAFRLEGVDGDWIDGGNRRQVRYASLPPGQYRFHLRAGNSDGVWSDDEVLLAASVAAPPWATSWALAGYGLLLMLAAAGTYGAYLRRRRGLESEVAARTAALTEQQVLIRRQARDLEQALEARTVLFANVSHEFRTPLTLVKASLDRIERDGPGPDTLATGRRYLRRLLRLVDQLLDFSRLSYEQCETSRQAWPIGRMVRLTVDAFSQVAEERGIELLPDFEPGWRTRCDQEQIEKILLNLLTNALKFTPAGGQVRVELKGGEHGVDLSVADSGPGIPENEQGTIFERFYRVPASEQGAVDGAGIGLALVKEAALANGGQVYVDSEPGRGSRFTVSLPAWREAHAAGPMVLLAQGERSREIESLMPVSNASSVRPVAESGAAMPRVLVVEDNADMRNYLSELLAPGWRVHQAADGEAGLKAARSVQPDVIVSDIMMPGLDGFELLARLRQDLRTSHIPVMLLTARRDRDTRVRSFSLAADDFLAKPFDAREFLARLMAMMERRKRLREDLRIELVGGGRSDDVSGTATAHSISTRDRELLKRLQDWLEAKHDDPEIKVADMAAAALVDARTLQRKLKSLLDRTPAGYLQEYRLRKARTMLRENGRAIKDVAAHCGFSSAQAFTKVFRQVEGMPPSEWRKMQGRPVDTP
ncbi:hybrid sensor histidine kinase/response regulator transcription factor [Wenzhouxiangella limi]|uniref:histidine kinase n=1 Tax=Wenzhouxiangella limi TaxID=2707351 RepID=A0A845UTN9_9GAMM|nr:ATP-binding protein [Wenzhouxiangella limi]NDY94887.1 response regulator [Wenzhouxiangella limi]